MVSLLYGHSFITGIIKVFIRSSSYALFLTQFHISQLPLVYIAASLAGLILSLLIIRLQQKAKTTTQIFFLIGLIFVINTSLFVCLHFSVSQIFIFLLPVWNELIINLIDIEGGILQASSLTIRQGKRLFAFIQSGEFLAEIGVGFFIGLLVSYSGTVSLVAASSVCISLLSVFYALLLKNQAREKRRSEHQESADNSLNRTIRSYVLSLVLTYVLLTIVYYFTDNAFYFHLSQSLHSEQMIAGFLGKFSAINSLCILVFLTFFSGKIIQYKGLFLSWIILPITIFLFALPVISFSLFPALSSYVFYLIIALQFLKNLIAFSFNRPSMAVFYQVLSHEHRNKLHTLIFGIIDPVFLGVTGLLLLFLFQQFSISSLTIFLALIPFLLGWIIIKQRSYGQYTGIIHNKINMRTLSGNKLALGGKETIDLLVEKTRSGNPLEIINSLQLLFEIKYSGMGNIISNLLNNSSDLVKIEVLRLSDSSESALDEMSLWDFFNNEQSESVKGEILKQIASIQGMSPEIRELYSTHPEYSVPILAGVLENPQSTAEGENEINALIKTNNKTSFATICAVLNGYTVKNTHVVEWIRTLLQSDISSIQEGACEAAIHYPSPDYLEVLFKKLPKAIDKQSISTAIAEVGDPAIPFIQRELLKTGFFTQIQTGISILSDIHTQQSASLLYSMIAEAEKDLLSSIAQTLVSFSQEPGNEDRVLIEKAICDLSDIFDSINYYINFFLDSNYTSLLIESLFEEKVRNRKLIYKLLYLLFRDTLLLDLEYISSSQRQSKVDFAVEYLDNLLPGDMKKRILPVIEESYTQKVPTKNDVSFTPGEDPVTDFLSNRLFSITSKCLLINNLSIHTDKNSSALFGKLSSLLSMKNDYLYNMMQHMVHSIVSRRTDRVGLPRNSRISYATKLERLKSISLFSDIQLDELIKITRITQYLSVKPDTSIVSSGSVINYLLFILSGSVRSHSGGEEYEMNSSLYELAALQDHNCSDTLVSVGHVELLRIDQKDLYMLMQQNMEIYQSIIKVLCNKNRDIISRKAKHDNN